MANDVWLQAAIRKIVDEFEVNGSDDYRRMDQQIQDVTGLRLDNKSLWALINKAKGQVERVSFTLDD